MKREPLVTAVKALGPLAGEVVFVGGSVLTVLITDPALGTPRATQHVDCITGAEDLRSYYRFTEALRAQGFEEASESGVICRFRREDLTLDVMPTTGMLGFSNRWYPLAWETAQVIPLAEVGGDIRVVLATVFLATKIEAFYGRGEDDFLSSADMEDIVTVLNGRLELLDV